MFPMLRSFSWALLFVEVNSIIVEEYGLDDYYGLDESAAKEEQWNQKKKMQKEIDDFESSDICPTVNNPHLGKFVKQFANETEQWLSNERKERVRANKSLDTVWATVYVNGSENDTDEEPTPQHACTCCFKHPTAVKVGARLAQAAIPHLADMIDQHIDNFSEAMLSEPDHTLEHIMNLVNNSSTGQGRSMVDADWPQLPQLSNCSKDVVAMCMDVVGMLVAVKSVVDAEAVAGSVAAGSGVGASFATLGGAGAKAMAWFTTLRNEGIAAAGIVSGATKVAGLFSMLYGSFQQTFGRIINDFVNSQSWYMQALTAIKLFAQIALWFATGLAALIATIVSIIANWISLGLHIVAFFGTHNCVR